MKVVTGGAGFIGSNLVRRFLSEGEDVLIIDNFHTGSEENVRGLRVIRGNAREIAKVNEPVDAVFHLGIFSSSPMYKKDPHLTAEAIHDFIKILEFCRKKDCNLVLASTSSLYNGHKTPHHEDLIPKALDHYTEARFYMERHLELYHRMYGINGVALRYFSVYGPYEAHKGRYANMISQFIWDIEKGKRPIIYGDGSQTRDFVFVEDVVEANLKASRYKGLGIFNIGTGRSYSFNQVVELINRTLNKEVKPIYQENPIKNYVMHTRADTRKSEEVLGFRAKVELEEGIRRTIQWNKERGLI
ncbi:MAG: NAD-dependent epimerase/dehydratase family protein [Candidatus Asgardarchaeia archaeon]